MILIINVPKKGTSSQERIRACVIFRLHYKHLSSNYFSSNPWLLNLSVRQFSVTVGRRYPNTFGDIRLDLKCDLHTGVHEGGKVLHHFLRDLARIPAKPCSIEFNRAIESDRKALFFFSRRCANMPRVSPLSVVPVPVNIRSAGRFSASICFSATAGFTSNPERLSSEILTPRQQRSPR